MIVTEKDAVKLHRLAQAGAAAPAATRVWVATLDFRPDDDTLARLALLLPAAPAARPPARNA